MCRLAKRLNNSVRFQGLRETLSNLTFFISKCRTPLHSNRGIALLIVLSVVTVIGIMGVAFLFSMYLESQSTNQFVSVTQAKLISEAGIAHARALLDEDGMVTSLDDNSEVWAQELIGTAVDVVAMFMPLLSLTKLLG